MSFGVNVDFNANVVKFTNQVDKLGVNLSRFERKVDSTSAAAGRHFKRMGAAFGLYLGADTIKGFVNVNREMEVLRARLKSIDSKNAEKSFKFIEAFAKNTPFQLQGLTKTFVDLKNFGIEPTEKVMSALTNQAARLGGSQDILSGITRALGQAYVKGKLQAEEMLQLTERGVPIYKLLAEVTGKNGSELEKMSKKGLLGVDVIDQLIVKMGELASGSNADQMDTLNGKFSNLSDAWTRFQDNLLDKRGGQAIKDFVDGAINALTALDISLNNLSAKKIKEFSSTATPLMKTVAKSAEFIAFGFGKATDGIYALAAVSGAITSGDFAAIPVIFNLFSEEMKESNKGLLDFFDTMKSSLPKTGDLNDSIVSLGASEEITAEKTEKLTQANVKLTKSSKLAADAAKKQKNSLERLIDRLFPAEAAQRKLRQEQELLDKAVESGVISWQQYDLALERLISKGDNNVSSLNDQAQAVKKLAGEYNGLGSSISSSANQASSSSFSSSSTTTAQTHFKGASIFGEDDFNINLKEFAQGGSFLVGGQGGTDSQTVAFKASPDERVTIETPAQQRNGSASSVFNITMNGVQNVRDFVNELENFSRTNPINITVGETGTING